MKELIFQIAATIIVSSTAGLSPKYKIRMVRNSNSATACYEDTIFACFFLHKF